MMTREEQIAFMEGCQERLRGYMSNLMQYSPFRAALRYHQQEQEDPPTTDTPRKESSRRFG
jgi:hypothetical protein